MQPTILFLFFVSCGLALETSLPDAVVNLLDVKKFPPAEENPSPNPEDGDISVNVEDLQRELIAERIKVRDLNQTISDILERMADMENNIMRNEEKITDNQSSVLLLSRDVDDLQEDVISVTGDVEKNSANITKVFEDVEENSALITNILDDVVSLTSSDQQQAMEIESLSSQNDSLGARGHWCGYKYSWSSVSTIPFDYINFSDSNMNITGTPLDVNTGINSHKCYHHLDIDIRIRNISGIFTVPVSGLWKMTFSLESLVHSGFGNDAYLYINGEQLVETQHYTYSESGEVTSTGSRVVTKEASAGDQIEIRTTRMDGTLYRILYCAEFIPKM